MMKALIVMSLNRVGLICRIFRAKMNKREVFALTVFMVIGVQGAAADNAASAEELYNKGTAYWNGYGGKKTNHKKACDLFERAAELGFGLAEFNLARCYENGVFGEKDVDLAIRYFERASEDGVERAVVELARIYLYGNYSDHKRDSVLEQLRGVFDAEDSVAASYAKLFVAEANIFGIEEKLNQEMVVSLLCDSAFSGNVIAQIWMYRIFSEGLLGEKEDVSKAKKWRDMFENNADRESAWALEDAVDEHRERELRLRKD